MVHSNVNSISLILESHDCTCVNMGTQFLDMYVAMQTSHACFVHRLLILFQLSTLTENQQVNFFPCWAALDYLELASMSANTMIFNTVISA